MHHADLFPLDPTPPQGAASLPPYADPQIPLQILAALRAATRDTPFATLLPGEAVVLSGFLFYNGSALIFSVARDAAFTLPGHPRTSSNALLLRHQAAESWRTLRDLLLLWAHRAGDTFLILQSQAIQDAHQILASFAPPPDPRARAPAQVWPALGFLPSALIVERYKQSVLRKRPRRAPATRPAAPPAPISRQKRTANEQRHAAATARLEQSFRNYLRSYDQTHGTAPDPPPNPLVR